MDDGKEYPCIIEDISSIDGIAYVVVHNPELAKRMIGQIPLNDQEKEAQKRYGDIVFGKTNGSANLRNGDIFALYDWILKSYESSTREQILKMLSSHPKASDFSQLPTEKLRQRYARETTKSLWRRTQKKAPDV